MKILLVAIGKTDAPYIQEGINVYDKRIIKYLPFELKILPDIKNSRNMSEEVQKEKEGDLILEQLTTTDYVTLLDEHGKLFDSVEFANFTSKLMVNGTKRLVFVIGGPYGFAPKIYNRANDKVSLSKMTFSHQMVRMIFVEQLYRAMTIIKGEPYHHI